MRVKETEEGSVYKDAKGGTASYEICCLVLDFLTATSKGQKKSWDLVLLCTSNTVSSQIKQYIKEKFCRKKRSVVHRYSLTICCRKGKKESKKP